MVVFSSLILQFLVGTVLTQINSKVIESSDVNWHLEATIEKEAYATVCIRDVG